MGKIVIEMFLERKIGILSILYAKMLGDDS